MFDDEIFFLFKVNVFLNLNVSIQRGFGYTFDLRLDKKKFLVFYFCERCSSTFCPCFFCGAMRRSPSAASWTCRFFSWVYNEVERKRKTRITILFVPCYSIVGEASSAFSCIADRCQDSFDRNFVSCFVFLKRKKKKFLTLFKTGNFWVMSYCWFLHCDMLNSLIRRVVLQARVSLCASNVGYPCLVLACVLPDIVTQSYVIESELDGRGVVTMQKLYQFFDKRARFAHHARCFALWNRLFFFRLSVVQVRLGDCIEENCTRTAFPSGILAFFVKNEFSISKHTFDCSLTWDFVCIVIFKTNMIWNLVRLG